MLFKTFISTSALRRGSDRHKSDRRGSLDIPQRETLRGFPPYTVARINVGWTTLFLSTYFSANDHDGPAAAGRGSPESTRSRRWTLAEIGQERPLGSGS